MRSETMLEVLQAVAFAWGLEKRHLETLLAVAMEVTFAEDEIIFREGDSDEALYLIQEGRVAIEMHVPGRGRVLLLTVGPGQLLGWSSLFPLKRKTANGRAVTFVRAIALNAAQLRKACQADHDLGYAIGWMASELIADRLRATRLQLMDVFAPRSKV